MGFEQKFFHETESIYTANKVEITYDPNNLLEIHCFVEGVKGDITFYRNFVDQYFEGFSIRWYICNGYKNVLETYKIIQDSCSTKIKNYKRSNFLFFIDKDFSDILHLDRAIDTNIFVTTSVYSIENYLVNEYIVDRLLREYFLIIENPIIEKMLLLFRDFYNDIQTIILKEISYISLFIRQTELTDPRKHNIKFDEIIDIEKIVKINYNDSLSKIEVQLNRNEYNLMKVSLASILGENNITDAIGKLVSGKNFKQYCRGHFEIQILVIFFNFIVKNLKKFSLKSDRIKDLPKNNFNELFIFILAAPRVKIPDELKKFLKLNYEEVIKVQ